MPSRDYSTEIIVQLVREYPKYPKEVYFFIQDVISHTIKLAKASESGNQGHIGGRQLLAGIKDYSTQKFGPLAIDVFTEWGITSTEDFGTIVFKMVQYKLLSAREEDTIDEFKNGFDFQEAFVSEFLPTKRDFELPVIA